MEYKINKKRSISFYIVLAALAFFLTMVLGRGVELYRNLPENGIYTAITLGVALMGYVCLIGIHMFQKWAVYLLGFLLFSDIISQRFFEQVQNNDGMFALFIFLGYGMVVWYPRWSFFK